MTATQSKFPQNFLAEPGQTDRKTTTITTDTTLTAEDHMGVFLVGTDALTITLPASVEGLQFTFVNIGADGNNIITVSPASTDGIWGTITLASSVVDLGGVAGKDLINTKSSSIKGDSATILGGGNSDWYVLASTGIWAAEA